MLLGVNMFLALLRAHLSPCLRLVLKMSLCRAKNIFTPANINFIVISSDTTSEHAMWSYDTGQRVSCFDSCQLTWWSNAINWCEPLSDLMFTKLAWLRSPYWCDTSTAAATMSPETVRTCELYRWPCWPWKEKHLGLIISMCGFRLFLQFL